MSETPLFQDAVENVQNFPVENQNLLRKIMMNFTCSTKELTDVCLAAARAVPGKSGNPELENLYIRTSDAGLIVTGFDGDFGVTGVVPCMTEQEGSVLVKAAFFCEMLKSLPGENARVSVGDNYSVHCESGVSVYNINGSGSDMYPELPYVAKGDPLFIDQKVFRELVRQTVFAVSPEDARVALRGVKIEITQNLITAVALDGYRVAIRREVIDYKGPDRSFIIPGKSLSEIVKFTGDEGTVAMTPGDKLINFGVNGYNIISRLLEGEFLDYNRVLPKQFATELRINSRDLLGKLTGMAFMSSADRQKTPVRCTVSGGEMKLNINSDAGVAETRIDVEQTGDDIEIGFNVNYFIDAVRAADSDVIILRLGTPFSPAAIVPPDGERYYYLVLPIRFR